jgi:thymidylate synthase (FAD)
MTSSNPTMVSALKGKKLLINGLLDGQGFVQVIDVSPNLIADDRTPEHFAAMAARISYDGSNKSSKADKGLIEFLVRNQHTSPLEMCNITFCLKLPVAMCRQLLRHRTSKFNEHSQRYCTSTDEMGRFKLNQYEKTMRGASKINHQASEFNLDKDQISKISVLIDEQEKLQDKIFEGYNKLIDAGLANELARFYLPTSTYTKIFVQFDLNNLVKFIRLRIAPDAQEEIACFARAILELAKQFFPVTLGVFEQYQDGVYLGKYEKQMIRDRKIPDEVISKTHRVTLEKLAKDLDIKLI